MCSLPVFIATFACLIKINLHFKRSRKDTSEKESNYYKVESKCVKKNDFFRLVDWTTINKQIKLLLFVFLSLSSFRVLVLMVTPSSQTDRFVTKGILERQTRHLFELKKEISLDWWYLPSMSVGISLFKLFLFLFVSSADRSNKTKMKKKEDVIQNVVKVGAGSIRQCVI